MNRADTGCMFESLCKLRELPAECQVFPAHHYGHTTSTTIGTEKKMNMLFGKVCCSDRMLSLALKGSLQYCSDHAQPTM
jgi:hypothetical protein